MLDQDDKQWIIDQMSSSRMQTVNELKNEINDLKLQLSSQKSEIQSLQRRLNESDQKLRDKDEALAAQSSALAAQDIKLDDLEQYGRRFGIRVENIPYVDGEDNDDLWPKLVTAFDELRIKIQPNEVARFHRTGKARNNRDGTYVRQCIVKFGHWSSREKFREFNKNAKAAHIDTRVNNDLTSRRLTLLNRARDIISAKMQRAGFTPDQLRGKDGYKVPDEQNVFAYANMNSHLCIRGKKRTFKFNTDEQLNDIISELF